jgi:hypothetical protein
MNQHNHHRRTGPLRRGADQPQRREPSNDWAVYLLVLPLIAAVWVSTAFGKAQDWALVNGWALPPDSPAALVVLPGGRASLDLPRLAPPVAAVLVLAALVVSLLVRVLRRGELARYRSWVRDTFALTVTALAAILAAPVLGGVLPYLAALSLLGAAGAVGYLGRRTNLRELDRARAIELAAPLLGAPPHRGMVAARRWSGPWPGRPARITVRYPSAEIERDGRRLAQLIDALSSIGWGAYGVERHDLRRHRLTLCPTEDTAPVWGAGAVSAQWLTTGDGFAPLGAAVTARRRR